jgi:glycosyltransferase involved in cell wall biosynthesis
MLDRPLISVLLPVYNGKKYVRAAVESILRQTETSFELIIIDDGSTDGSHEVVNEFDDPRIIFIGQENHGLAASLNTGLAKACGKYVARQDQDDISAPARFALQTTFLEKNPACALLGTAAWISGGDSSRRRFHRHPEDCARLRFELLFNNPFVHSSVMIRRDAVLSIGGYSTDPTRQPPEDYELWSRIARKWEVRNLPDVLVEYREIPGSMSRQPSEAFRLRLARISAENIAHFSGKSFEQSLIVSIARLAHQCDSAGLPRPRWKEVSDILQRALLRIDPKSERIDLRRSAIWKSLLVMCADLSRHNSWFNRAYNNNCLRKAAKAFAH